MNIINKKERNCPDCGRVLNITPKGIGYPPQEYIENCSHCGYRAITSLTKLNDNRLIGKSF